MNDILLWYAISTLTSVAFAPLILSLFRHLADRGAFVVRPIASLLLVWPPWLLAGIGPGVIPFGAPALWGTLAIGGILSWFLGIRNGTLNRVAIRHLLIAEAGFVIAFAAFVLFHGYGPQLTDQEKLSDLMMLSSTMRAEEMPPADAWLSGHTINYYYIGYVIWAGLARLTGATPAIAFNLALSSIFATTVVTTAGLAGNVLARWTGERLARIGGVLAVVFLLGGNPWGVFRILGDPARWWDTTFGNFAWSSTRIIDRETAFPAITELPAFSFALADLHPHLMALPYTLAALACAWLLATGSEGEGWSLRARWPALALTGWVVGALYAMNSWDFPTYLAIALLGLLAGTRACRWRDRLAAGAVTLVSSVALWLPFHAAFAAPERSSKSAFAGAVEGIPVIGGILASLAGVTGERTPIGDYVVIFGFTYAIALLLIGIEWWRRQDRAADPAVLVVAGGTALVLILGGVLVPMPLLVLGGLPLVAIGLLLGRDASLSLANVALVLFGVAFALTLVPEFVYLLDIFGVRMNTIFKLYYQAWTLTALGAVVGLAAIWQVARSWRPGAVLLPAVATALALMLLTYPVVIAKQWLDWRNAERDWLGMDGLAFLEDDARFSGEYAGIDWLLANATQDDVMLVAGGCEWSNTVGRTASASGVPSILGWPGGHEGAWHLGDDAIANEFRDRTAAITSLGTEIDAATIERYGVTLIFLGPVELDGGGPEAGPTCAPGPFPGASDPAYPGPGWTLVFTEDDVRIFRRDGT